MIFNWEAIKTFTKGTILNRFFGKSEHNQLQKLLEKGCDPDHPRLHPKQDSEEDNVAAKTD